MDRLCTSNNLGQLLCNGSLTGQIYLAYTHFKNTVVHVPTLMKLLPVEFSEEDMSAADKNLIMNFFNYI